MNYNVYLSASETVYGYGQVELSKRFLEHAEYLERKKIENLKFDILVGNTKLFSGAKYESMRSIREKEGVTLLFIFKSGENTHRINCNLKSDGSLVWADGNLFKNRLSVRKFSELIDHLSNYHKDIKKLNIDRIKLVSRTFYI